MSADARVTAAREYLDGARRRKVTELPPSLLVRECAELRRCLGQVLDVLDGGQVLAEADRATVLGGLAVAAEARRYQASITCVRCAEHPADLCEDCAAQLDAADAYDELAGRIGSPR